MKTVEDGAPGDCEHYGLDQLRFLDLTTHIDDLGEEATLDMVRKLVGKKA